MAPGWTTNLGMQKNWAKIEGFGEKFGKELERWFVSKSLSGAVIKKSLDFSKFRITDG